MSDGQHDDQARGQGLPPAGWYPDPAGGPSRRWWDGSGWTHDLEGAGAGTAPAQQQQREQQQGEQQPAQHGEQQQGEQDGADRHAPEHAPVVPQPGAGGLPAYGQYQQQQYQQQQAQQQAQQYGQQPTHQQQSAQQAQPWGRPQQQPLPEGTSVSTPWIWLIVLFPLLSLVDMLTVDWSTIFAASLEDPAAVPEVQLRDVLSTLLSVVLWGLTVLFAWLDHKALLRRGIVAPFHWAYAFIPVTLVYVIGRTVVLRRRVGRGSAPLWVLVGVLVLSTIAFVAIVGTAAVMGFEQGLSTAP